MSHPNESLFVAETRVGTGVGNLKRKGLSHSEKVLSGGATVAFNATTRFGIDSCAKRVNPLENWERLAKTQEMRTDKNLCTQSLQMAEGHVHAWTMG